MSRYHLVINGSPYQVEIGRISGTRASVTVNGVAYDVVIPAAAPAAAPAVAAAAAAPVAAASVAPAAPAPSAPSAAALSSGGEVISAPMPGHILSVLVSPGDSVEVGDTVLVMEAMKMENEIKAHVSGTVSEVKVAKGQDVGVGEVLVVIGG
ncbi:MAG: biotin/lipoyl-containing protein [Deferrisomatales bacterium]